MSATVTTTIAIVTIGNAEPPSGALSQRSAVCVVAARAPQTEDPQPPMGDGRQRGNGGEYRPDRYVRPSASSQQRVELPVVERIGERGVRAGAEQLLGRSARYGIGGLGDGGPKTDAGDAELAEFGH